MGQESIRRYEFNGFWIDVAGRRLRSPDGIAIDLPARAFDVLLYLIDHRGEDISKERLMSAASTIPSSKKIISIRPSPRCGTRWRISATSPATS